MFAIKYNTFFKLHPKINSRVCSNDLLGLKRK